MSEVSFIPPAPAAATRSSRAPEKNAGAETAAAPHDKSSAPPEAILSRKTKVKTEQLTKFTFGYTFLDPETLRVVGQYPVTPPIGAYRK